MDNIEMLKALYDFQAVYPKTISFDEGEYFILYQTSARQRNWWQVVSMKGNIGFVPSNYVMKIKVEPDFLISFLNSSIESLEQTQEHEINGIMPKLELLERLREKKLAMEKLYLDNSEHDCDSSLSCSQSLGGGIGCEPHYKSPGSSSASGAKAATLQQQQSTQAKRLDSGRKSLSSPAVGAALPQIIAESPSMGCMQQQQAQAASAPPASKASDNQAQDNSITSEPSETTTTTTTTSEDVVTTYKEPSQRDSAASASSCRSSYTQHNGSSNGGGVGGTAVRDDCDDDEDVDEDVDADDDVDVDDDVDAGGDGVAAGAGAAGTVTEISEQITDERLAEKSDGSEVATNSGGADDGRPPSGERRPHYANSVDNSQALDSEDSGAAAVAIQLSAAGYAAAPLPPPPTAAAVTAAASLQVQSSDVYQIVDVIRRNTNLSFELSCEALRVALTSLEQLYNGAINPYLEAVAVHVTDKVPTPKALLGMTHDAKRLQYIFAQLADCKNDAEQRSWMLYEDEDDILQFLEELLEILNNADEHISCYEMSCDQYQVLSNLVQYYQMETRWPIKRLLLQTFTAACHLDHIIVDILLTSVLPLEIVEDMKTNFANLERFKQLVKMLTIIFSLGQPMPVNHQDFLGVHFASFLLEIVEGNNPEALVDLVIALILAFNLQFGDTTQNVVIEAMQQLQCAKAFTEKILLLLNREEDPIKLLKHSSETLNSVLKIFIDIFSNTATAGIFYTNDNNVLIDILVRQLSDLCAGNPLRRLYLELCRGILRNTNYQAHQHRKQDLMKIFTRIFCEETECSASDQQLVREIANEFPQLFKA